MQAERCAYVRYLVDQLVRPIVNLYRVTPVTAGESPAGRPIAFVRQKRMAIKEDIRFFADEQETEELFRIKAHERQLDRRIAIAPAIGLDPLQNR